MNEISSVLDVDEGYREKNKTEWGWNVLWAGGLEAREDLHWEGDI